MDVDGDGARGAETRRRVWVTLAFVMLGTFAAQLALIAWLLAIGYGFDELQRGLPPDLRPWQLLVSLALIQALSYLLPGVLAARSLFGGAWVGETRLAAPAPVKVLIAVLIFAACLPFVGYLAQVNAGLEIGEWAGEIEGDVAAVLSGIITETSPAQFALVLVAVGLLPALGEELVFRGLLQPGFIRMTGSAHAGIWLTAAFFGLVHLQFAGLLPRVFLGAVLGFLVHRSGRLWLPIVAHALFNGAQAVAARLGALEVAPDAAAGAASAAEGPALLAWGLASAAFAAAALRYGLPYLGPGAEPPSGASPAAGAPGA